MFNFLAIKVGKSEFSYFETAQGSESNEPILSKFLIYLLCDSVTSKHKVFEFRSKDVELWRPKLSRTDGPDFTHKDIKKLVKCQKLSKSLGNLRISNFTIFFINHVISLRYINGV